MSSRTSRGRCRCTGARSSRASARCGEGWIVRSLVALRVDGQELRADDARARREAGRGGGRRRPARLADVRRPSRGGDEAMSSSFPTARTTSPRAASAPGPSSPRRSSRRRASIAGSAGSRPRSSAARPRVRRTRSCAASAARRSSRTGAKAFASVSRGSLALSPGGLFDLQALAERLPPARGSRRTTRPSRAGRPRSRSPAPSRARARIFDESSR